MTRKVQVTVYLTEQQINALKTLKEKTLVPTSVYIRQGIEEVLEKNKMREAPKIIRTELGDISNEW